MERYSPSPLFLSRAEVTWVMSGGAPLAEETEFDKFVATSEIFIFFSWSVGKVWQDLVSELLLDSFAVG